MNLRESYEANMGRGERRMVWKWWIFSAFVQEMLTEKSTTLLDYFIKIAQLANRLKRVELYIVHKKIDSYLYEINQKLAR